VEAILGKNAEAMEKPGDWDRFHVEMVVLLDVLGTKNSGRYRELV